MKKETKTTKEILSNLVFEHIFPAIMNSKIPDSEVREVRNIMYLYSTGKISAIEMYSFSWYTLAAYDLEKAKEIFKEVRI